jgi:hypothetical protein
MLEKCEKYPKTSNETYKRLDKCTAFLVYCKCKTLIGLLSSVRGGLKMKQEPLSL